MHVPRSLASFSCVSSGSRIPKTGNVPMRSARGGGGKPPQLQHVKGILHVSYGVEMVGMLGS